MSRSKPSSSHSHSGSASAARLSSAIMPAALTSTRWWRLGKAEAAEASTKGTGMPSISVTPACRTRPPQRRTARPCDSSCSSLIGTNSSAASSAKRGVPSQLWPWAHSAGACWATSATSISIANPHSAATRRVNSVIASGARRSSKRPGLASGSRQASKLLRPAGRSMRSRCGSKVSKSAARSNCSKPASRNWASRSSVSSWLAASPGRCSCASQACCSVQRPSSRPASA